MIETSHPSRHALRPAKRYDGRMMKSLATSFVAVTAGALAGAFEAKSQQSQSLPGITIVSPNAGPAPSGPPQTMPGVMIQQPPQAQQPPVQQAPPKPKPQVRPAPRSKPKAPAVADEEGGNKPTGPTRIAVLVNGEPITGYEIEQRARLMALGENIQSRAQERMKALATSESVTSRWKSIVEETVRANQGKTREQIMAILQEKQKALAQGLQKQAIEGARSAVMPELRKRAREELIEEQLKLQDAKNNKTSPDENMVEDLIKDIAQRNKMTSDQFGKHFGGMGVDISTLRAKFRAQLAWTGSVRRQFAHLEQPSNLDIDRMLQKATGGGEDQLELQLQRIVVPLPAKVDQRAMAQRLGEAEQMQREFKRCATASILSAKIQGARHENMGVRRLSTFEEPTRSLLSTAKEETMLPPTITSSGIELYAVCSRKVIKAEDERRTKAQQELIQGGLEARSRGRLRYLRETAVIENR